MAETFAIIGNTSFYGSNFATYVVKQRDEVAGISLRDHHRWRELKSADYVLNFAAMNIVADSWKHPLSYCRVNFLEHLSVVTQLLRSKRLKKYIHVSTPEVYGNTPTSVDEHCPFNPSTPYAVSRAATDMVLKAYHEARGFPMLITRTANIYGPEQQSYRVIPAAFKAKRLGKRLPLHGGGTSRRSFIHVRDACAATYLLAKEGAVGETYHISTNDSLTIAELCERIEVQTEDAPERMGKDQQYLMRSDKIRRLGWMDKITLDQGLKEYAEYANRAAHDQAGREIPA